MTSRAPLACRAMGTDWLDALSVVIATATVYTCTPLPGLRYARTRSKDKHGRCVLINFFVIVIISIVNSLLSAHFSYTIFSFVFPVAVTVFTTVARQLERDIANKRAKTLNPPVFTKTPPPQTIRDPFYSG